MALFLPALLVAFGIGSADLPRIRTESTSLVASGKPILLKGVNLGGWLVEEPWMLPWSTDPPSGSSQPKADTHTAIWKEIEGRLGTAAMKRVRDAWHAGWIGKDDFDAIKRAGFNHVRIPFLASLLEEPGGLATLHTAVDEANAAGLYVVLDMHGAPGGQSDEAHNGLGKSNRLWFEPANIRAFESAWTQLATEFGGSGVAMFDIMNEPMGAPNPAMLHLVYDRVIRAIRKVNKETVVLVEDGYKGFETTPHPNVPGWTNVCFSLHFYDFNAKAQADHLTSLAADIKKDVPLEGYRSAPLYIGEFNLEPFAGADVTHQFVSQMEGVGWSWAIWTWKAAPKNGTLGQWGVMRPKSPVRTIDPFVDSEEAMIAKIEDVKTSNFEPVPGVLEALTHG